MGVSRSTLHRYCAGKAVPAEFEPVRRLAEQAEASAEDVAELRRLWELATDRRTDDADEADAPAAVSGDDGTESGTAEATQAAPTPTAPSPTDADTPDAATPAPDATDADTSDGNTPDPAQDDTSAATVVSAPPGGDGPEEKGGRRRWVFVAAAAGVVAAVLAGVVFAQSSDSDDDTDDARPAKEQLLLTERCEELISVGQEGTCVKELQTLLSKAGATIGIDSSFGPETTRRVLAFQVKAGLDVDGLVGENTKRALYEAAEPGNDGKGDKTAAGAADVDLSTWDQAQVEKKIREVFDETAEDAVKLATCQSQLDPLHIVPNDDESRSWGLFQLPDAQLSKLGGSPEKALDPDWSITAAHKLWAEDKSFSDLPKCAENQ